jgi:hypothetical protein
MARYKFIGLSPLYARMYKENQIYSGDHRYIPNSKSVKELHVLYPADWQLIPDEPGKLDELIEKWEQEHSKMNGLATLKIRATIKAFITDLKSLKQ